VNADTPRTEEWVTRLEVLLAELERQNEGIKASVEPQIEQTKKRASKKR
jgi:hypothetical protein